MAGSKPGEVAAVYRSSGLLTFVAVLPSTVLMIFTRWSPTTPFSAIAEAIAIGSVCWFITLRALTHPLALEFERIFYSAGEPLISGDILNVNAQRSIVKPTNSPEYCRNKQRILCCKLN